MSTYAKKAQLWNSIYSTTMGLTESAGQIAQMSRNFRDIELENNLDDYQKVIDYTDQHQQAIGYSSREGFVKTASYYTGVNESFINKMLDTTKWDPTIEKNVGMTEWLTKNNLGTESWRAKRISQLLDEDDSGKIKTYLQQGLTDAVNTEIENNPYSLENWSAFTDKKLTELMNPENIAEATGISIERVKVLMDDSSISDNVYDWYNNKFAPNMDELKFQQQQAKIRQNTTTGLNYLAAQSVAEEWSDEEFMSQAQSMIDSSGLNLITNPYERDRITYDAYNYYVAQKTAEWGKQNVTLSKKDFIKACSKFNEDLRYNMYISYQASGKDRELPDDFKTASPADYALAYENAQNERDSANEDYIVNTNRLVAELQINPEMALSFDTPEKIIQEIGFSDMAEVYKDNNKFSSYSRATSAVSSALGIINENINKQVEAADKMVKDIRTQYTAEVTANFNAMPNNVKSGDTVTFDEQIAVATGGLFTDTDTFVDNNSSEVINEAIKAFDESMKKAGTVSGDDTQKIAIAVSSRNVARDGVLVDCASITLNSTSVTTEIKPRTSPDDEKYALFGDDYPYEIDRTLNPASIAFTADKYMISDWAVLGEDGMKAGLVIYDYSGFVDFVESDEDIKEKSKNPYYMRDLAIQWNMAIIGSSDIDAEAIAMDSNDLQVYTLLSDRKYDEAYDQMNDNISIYKSDMGRYNTMMSRIEAARGNDKYYEFAIGVVNDVISDIPVNKNGAYYNEIINNNAMKTEMAINIARDLRDDKVTPTQAVENANAAVAKKIYDSGMKQTEKFLRDSTLSFSDMQEGTMPEYNANINSFRDTYKMMSEGTYLGAISSDYTQYSAWMMNAVAGNKVTFDDVYEYIWETRNKDKYGNIPDKVEINGKNIKKSSKDENNVFRSQAVDIYGSLMWASSKSEYMMQAMKNAGIIDGKNVNESNMMLVNLKTDRFSTGSIYDIALYDKGSGAVYFMPGDCTDYVYQFRVDYNKSNLIDAQMSLSSRMVTINDTMLDAGSMMYSVEKDKEKTKQQLKASNTIFGISMDTFSNLMAGSQ